MTSRTVASAAALVLVALFILGVKGWQALRVALLPELDESALSGVSLDEQRALWLEYDEVLQCQVLDPCLDTMTGNGWSTPGRIAAVCGASHATLAALPVPAELVPQVSKNARFLRDYWLGYIQDVAGAAQQASGNEGGVNPFSSRFFSWNLDTCTGESLPARIDQLLGVVAPGGTPAKCAALRRLRSAEETDL